MAVVGWTVGGAVATGVIAAAYGNYSDYSDYSNYDNYSNYSDAAERRQRRLAAKQEEVNQKVQEVNQYKINPVNNYLETERLIAETGATVSVEAVRADGFGKIERAEEKDIQAEGQNITREIAEIDSAIKAIDRILEENKV